MSSSELQHDAQSVTARFRHGAETHDIDEVVSTLAADAVLRSPITDRIEFRGHAEIRELLGSVFATIHDIRYFADIGDQRVRALFYRATIGGRPVEEATRIELNDRGEIEEITLFFRPLPALAGLTAELAPRVARRHGRLRVAIARLLIGPLGPATRAGDRLAPWLV